TCHGKRGCPTLWQRPSLHGQFMPLGGIVRTAMHIFKTRHFQRWMRKTALSDSDLRKAVLEMAAGLIDADLGGGVVKKRIGLAGRGKRGGVRTLVATNKGNRWFFVFGFEKNERDNISDAELQALQDYAADLLERTAAQLDAAAADGTLLEITDD
ncbi:type II toxin-antitoxin system RelE/ParE family toxin, partial [Pseudomonas aeruginosa]